MSTTMFVREACRLLASASMLSFARRICPSEAEDVLQDAAVKIVEIDRRGFEPRSVPAITFLIVKHAALDRLHKRGRDIAALDVALANGSRLLACSAGIDVADAGGPDVEAERLDAIDLGRQLDWLSEAMQSIDPLLAEQLRLTYLDPNAPPVRQRDVPFGTVVSRTSRAKAELRANLERRGRLDQVRRTAGRPVVAVVESREPEQLTLLCG
jgi:DNA-directed RNA polymerase specialized sigma24 family protein